MKIGDYVRTKDGIEKVLEYTYNKNYENGHCILFDNKDHRLLFTDEDVNKMKPNPNIIGLIGVGDLMLIDISPDDCGGIVVPRIAETQAELDEFINKMQKGEYILKGLLTKEQIESEVN